MKEHEGIPSENATLENCPQDKFAEDALKFYLSIGRKNEGE